MNSIIGDKRVPLRWVVLISAALQAAALLVFILAEPLRTSRLTAAEVPDARAADRAAEERLRQVEQERRRERERTPLEPEDAEAMARREEQKQAEDIRDRLRDMQAIREELVQDANAVLSNLAARTVQDVSFHLYEQLHPLATQLVARAEVQRAEIPLPAAPGVAAASGVFLALVERGRDRLLEPAVFAGLQTLHGRVQDGQHRFILQLDEAQAAYPGNQDRIHRENHLEYRVNLMRDRIAEILGEAAALDPAAMNDLPADLEIPGPLPADWEASLDGQSVPDLHAEAESLFGDIEQAFAGARAAHLAMEQHASMAAAWEQVNVPGPESVFDAAGLPGSPGTVSELNEYAAALGRAARDVNRLWQSARNMGAAGRAMAGRAASPAGASPGGPEGGGRVGARGTGASSAAAGRAGRYADLTPFMYSSGSGEKGFASSMGGGLDITARSIRSGYVETGPGTPGAKGPPLLSEDQVLKEALPGRTFSRSSPRTGWLYLDTWYVIGPWDNPGRIGHAQSRPPETLVDLDAEYTGKGGRTLRWQFHQSDNIRVKPPDETESSVYYAWTEVYFEEEMEMLVAVASDDAARIWLNDQVIWQDDGLGPWRLDEGFRKVVFRQGFNTLLVRIENGPITCTYSILLCPPDVLFDHQAG